MRTNIAEKLTNKMSVPSSHDIGGMFYPMLRDVSGGGPDNRVYYTYLTCSLNDRRSVFKYKGKIRAYGGDF